MKSPLFFLFACLLVLFGGVEAQAASAAKVETRIQLMFHEQSSGTRNVTITFNGETITTRVVNGIDQYSLIRRVTPGVKNRLVLSKDSGVLYSYAVVADGHMAFSGGRPASAVFEGNRSSGDFVHEFVLSEKEVSGRSGGAPLGMDLEPAVADLDWGMSLGTARNGADAGYLAVRDETLGASTHLRSNLAACLSPVAFGEFELIHTDENNDGFAESLRQIMTKRNLIDVVDLPGQVGYQITVREGGSRTGSSGPYTPSGATLVSHRVERISPVLLRITREEPGTSRTVVTEFEKPTSGATEWVLRRSGGGVSKRTEVTRTETTGGFVRTWTHSYDSAPAGNPAALNTFSLRRVYYNLAAVDGFQPAPRVLEETTDPGVTGAEATTIYSYYDSVQPQSRELYGLLGAMKGPYGDFKTYSYYNFGRVAVTPDANNALYDNVFYDLWRHAVTYGGYELFHSLSLLSGSLQTVIRTGDDNYPFDIDGGPNQFATTTGVPFVLELHIASYDWDEFSPITIPKYTTYGAAPTTSSSIYDNLVDLNGSLPVLLPLNHSGSISSDFVQITRDYHHSSYTGTVSNPTASVSAMTVSGRLVPAKQDASFDYRKAFKPWYSVDRDNSKTSFGYRSVPSYRGISDAWCELEVTGTQVQAKTNWLNQVTVTAGSQTYSRRQLFYEQATPLLEGPLTAYPSSTRSSAYSDYRPRLLSATQMSHAFESGSGAAASNFTVDNLSLVSGKSTKTVRVHDSNGNLRYVETWAYVGTAWKLLSLKTLQSDGFGRVTQIDEQRGEGSPSRTVYEAGYSGLLISHSINGQGLRVDYQYDGLGRTSGSTLSSRSGAGVIPGSGQNSLVTYQALDCLDRVVETRVGGSNGRIVSASSQDLTGRVRFSTDADGLTTFYSYSKEPTAGLRIDITRPGGAQEVHIHHQNGKPKSSTGNGMIAVAFQHGYTFGAGNLPFATSSTGGSGSSGPQSTTRWNWLGQVVYQARSTSVSASNEASYTYLSTNARLTDSLHTEVSENGGSTSQATRSIYEYDAFGSLTANGIDVNANGSLTDASTDLISRSDSVFVLLNGQVHVESSQKSLTEDGSSGSSVSSVIRTQLTGLAADVMADRTVTDMNGNETRELVTVERGPARITSTTTHADGGNTVSIQEMGFAKSEVSRHGQTRLVEYDSEGRTVLLRTSTGSRSFATRIIPETGKNRTSKVVEDLAYDGSGSGRTFEFGYDAAGRKNLTVLPDGKVIGLGYDSRGLLVKKWGNGTQAEWFVRDPVYGWLTDHHKWQSLPGQEPDLASATQPPSGSTVTHYAYYPGSGQVSSCTEAFGTAAARTTSFTYDALGNLRTRVLPGAAASAGLTATPAVTVTMTWNAKTSRLTGISYNDSVTTDLAFTHSRAGTLATVVEKPKGLSQITRTLHHYLTGNGPLALQALDEDLPAYYQTIPALATNDTAHSATRIIQGRTTTATKGRLSSLALGTAGGSPGTLATTRMATSYGYQNALLNEVGIGAAQPISFGYEASGTRINSRLSTPALNETIQRHPLRDVVSKVWTSSGGTVRVSSEYGFDENGRRRSITRSGSQFEGYGGSLYEVFTRSGSGRLSTATTHAGGSASKPVLPGRAFSYEIDGADNLLSIQRPGAPGGGTTFGINALDEFSSRQNSAWVEVAGMIPQPWNVAIRDSLAADPLVPDRVEDYYHAWKEIPGSALRGRPAELLAVRLGAGDADPAHPGTNLDLFTSKPLSLLARPSSEVPTRDARGNLTADALWTYTWDATNRLTSIESTAAAIAAGKQPVKLGFRYDWLGRRYMKEHFQRVGSTWSAKPGKVTLFWWDGWNLLREATYTVTWGATNPTAAAFVEETRYHRGPDLGGRLHGLGGIGGLVASQWREAGQAAQPPRYPAYDGNGNIVAMLDGSGASVAEFEYDPYGRLLRASGPEAEKHRVRFATQYHDAETGLYYHQFRYYDPGSGRFLSRDPAGAAGNFHPYAYADNQPVDGVEAFGLALTSSFYFNPGSSIGGGPNSGLWGYRSSFNWSTRSSFSLGSVPSFASRQQQDQFTFQSRVEAGSHIGQGSGQPFNSRADLIIVSAAFNSAESMDPAYSYRNLIELGQKEFRAQKDVIAGQILIARLEGNTTQMQFGIWGDELDKMGPGYEGLATDARRIKHSMLEGESDYELLSGTVTGLTIITQPEAIVFKGIGAIVTGIKGLSYADDVVRATKISPSAFARSQQGSGAYLGIDRWRDITLKKGTIIFGGEPGQTAFYTTGSAIRRAGDSATDIFQGLQVAPHPIYGYRPAMTAYEVIEDVPAAFGRTLANPQHGVGGLPQIVIPDFKDFLRPIYTSPLSP